MEHWVKEEWRKLGFYFARQERSKSLRMVGSREGLQRFRDLLIAYVADPRNDQVSEHEHYGPFGSLEIMTAASAGMDDHAIFGTVADLKRLADIVKQSLDTSTPGAVVRISDQYSQTCAYALLLDVREDGFDPPAAEAELYGGAV